MWIDNKETKVSQEGKSKPLSVLIEDDSQWWWVGKGESMAVLILRRLSYQATTKAEENSKWWKAVMCKNDNVQGTMIKEKNRHYW